MFEKVLIANRGEIALRVIRACKELGIRTLAVYSEADVDSLHVQLADEAICIGPPPSSDSYLKIDRIISAAEIGDVDAIHPGYGFLSENAHFADVCESCNIKFIGPPPARCARWATRTPPAPRRAKPACPSRPAATASWRTEQEALRVAKKIGYPVMIKAIAGGGGRGMRAAHNDVSLVQGYHAARTEAEKAFGNAGVYIEKLIENPHHIEFQIMADSHGNVVHLGERDCSMQRRNQKIIEECPSPLITHGVAQENGPGRGEARASRSATWARAPWSSSSMTKGNYYFMEMNTRIQVEHPITEEVYGCDLVKEQIQIAAGDRLSAACRAGQSRVPRHRMPHQCGGSVQRNFQPRPGEIDLYYAPGGRGVRIDSHAYAGYTVPPHYDSMIAKVIAMGATRANAIDRMRRALERIHHHRDQDDDSVSRSDHARPRFSAGQLRHRLRRSGDEFGILRAQAFERAFARVIAPAVKSLDEARLYAILDLGYVAASEAERIAGALLEGGADVLQLRGKKESIEDLAALAGKLHRLTHAAGVPLIINDHPEIARDLPVEGLHLGQDDLPIARAREIVRRECCIGKSTHSLTQATAAHRGGRRLHRLWSALCDADKAGLSVDRHG